MVKTVVMRQSAIGFYSKKLELEGIFASPQDPGARDVPAVIACHSNPLLGGNMNDPVVAAVCQAVVREGMCALRFNFRGVGDSQGEFTNGKEEHNDVKSALNVMRHWPSVHGGRIAVVGYSTGATIVLDGLRHLRRAKALVLVAPTLGALRSRRFNRDKRPRLVIAGSDDRVSPSLEVQRILDECRGPFQFHEVVGADHSMRGYESEAAEVTADFLKRYL